MSFPLTLPKERRFSRLMTTGAAAITFSVMLQGCLLNRLDVAQQQACEWQDAVTITAGDRPGMRFSEPLFLRSDVETMVGAPPTRESRTGEGWNWTYVVEKVEVTSAHPTRYVTELTFREHDGAPRLERVEVPPEARPFLTEEYLDDLFSEVCDLEWTRVVFARGVKQTLAPEQLALMPDRETLIALLGPPTEDRANGDAMHYAYRLLGEEDTTELGAFTVWFDRLGVRPTRIEGQTQRLKAAANLCSGEVVMEAGF